MATKTDERIAALKERRGRLTAQLAQLEGKKKNEQCKRDTRRKIVVGGTVLAAMEKDAALRKAVCKLLAASVTREIDRAVLTDLLGPVTPPNP